MKGDDDYKIDTNSTFRSILSIQVPTLPTNHYSTSKSLFFQQITILPTNPEPQTIMCVGKERSHACGHYDNFVVTSQCANARRNGRDCDEDQCTIALCEIIPPPLCPHCFRVEEKKICDEADKKRNEILVRLDYDKQVLEGSDFTASGRTFLESRIADATSLIDENRAERALKLKNFRESQGVWGDG